MSPDALNVKVAEPVPLIAGGSKLAESPGGKSSADNATLPVKPFVLETVTVNVTLLLVMTFVCDGDNEIEKPTTGLTNSNVGCE